MKKIVIINGLIAGVIVSGMMLLSLPLMKSGTINYDKGMILGYASMVIALSVVFFGIKTYRDQEQNGSISFGQAFKVGILIAIIASLLYATTWEIYYNTAGSDFTEHYSKYYLDKMRSEGASESEIKEAQLEMEAFGEKYKNPVIRYAMTLMEIIPVGLIIALISAAILRRKEILPA